MSALNPAQHRPVRYRLLSGPNTGRRLTAEELRQLDEITAIGCWRLAHGLPAPDEQRERDRSGFLP